MLEAGAEYHAWKNFIPRTDQSRQFVTLNGLELRKVGLQVDISKSIFIFYAMHFSSAAVIHCNSVHLHNSLVLTVLLLF